MKDAREKIINSFLCAKTNTRLLNNQNKIYYILLHEDFYTILAEKSIHSRNNESASLFHKKTSSKSQAASFLKVKKIISKFRSNQFNEIRRSFFRYSRFKSSCKKFFQTSKKFSNRYFDEEIEFFFESIAFILLSSHLKEKKSDNFCVRGQFNISTSLHKPLEFFEKEWQYSSFGFQGKIFFFFHPEILIRILRKNCQDVSFLHLIRKLLHLRLDSLDDIFIYLLSKKVRHILWNLYALEVDNFFVSCCNSYWILHKKIFPNINSSTSFFQKIKDWTHFVQKERYSTNSIEKVSNLTDQFQTKISNATGISFSFLAHSFPYKYFRSNTTLFFLVQRQKPWTFLLERSIAEFFVRRLGYTWEQITELLLIASLGFQRESTYYFFLAYIFQFPKKKSWTKINTKLFSLLTYFVRKTLFLLNPFDLLVFLLSKYNFCSPLGSPLSKSSWLIWTDMEIIQSFSRIKDSFFLHYSACQNRRALYKIHYILYLSCCKTLAWKHKANLRQISNKIGNKFRIFDFRLLSSSFLRKSYPTNSRLRFLYENQKENRVWSFQLTKLDSILVFVEELYSSI
jgi:hypothetical protein